MQTTFTSDGGIAFEVNPYIYIIIICLTLKKCMHFYWTCRYGARDENGTALGVAISSRDEELLNRLLAVRVHPDSDYKINKKGLPAPVDVNVFLPSAKNISYSSMFPNVPTIIDWHNNTNVQLPFVRWV